MPPPITPEREDITESVSQIEGRIESTPDAPVGASLVLHVNRKYGLRVLGQPNGRVVALGSFFEHRSHHSTTGAI